MAAAKSQLLCLSQQKITSKIPRWNSEALWSCYNTTLSPWVKAAEVWLGFPGWTLLAEWFQLPFSISCSHPDTLIHGARPSVTTQGNGSWPRQPGPSMEPPGGGTEAMITSLHFSHSPFVTGPFPSDPCGSSASAPLSPVPKLGGAGDLRATFPWLDPLTPPGIRTFSSATDTRSGPVPQSPHPCSLGPCRYKTIGSVQVSWEPWGELLSNLGPTGSLPLLTPSPSS